MLYAARVKDFWVIFINCYFEQILFLFRIVSWTFTWKFNALMFQSYWRIVEYVPSITWSCLPSAKDSCCIEMTMCMISFLLKTSTRRRRVIPFARIQPSSRKKVIPRDLCPDDGCHCLLCLIHVGLPILNFYNGWGMLVTVSGTFVCWSSDSGCILWWRLANQMCHASSCKKYQPNQHVRWNSMQIDNLHIHILIFTNHICS